MGFTALSAVIIHAMQLRISIPERLSRARTATANESTYNRQRRIADGDEEAFRHLFDTYFDRVMMEWGLWQPIRGWGVRAAPTRSGPDGVSARIFIVRAGRRPSPLSSMF